MTKPLYKYDSKGKLRIWFMTQEGASFTTSAGLADGKLTTSAPTVCVGKQGRTDVEQAASEIASGYEYQLKREYFISPEAAAGEARFFKPMLAQSWKDIEWDGAIARIAKERVSTKTLVGTGITSQPKLDGFCCLAQASGLTSREGQPIVSCPHIERALAPFFHAHPDAVLHGELYNHDLADDFEELSSVIAQKKPTEADLATSAAFAQFHIYDYPAPGVAELPFSERSELLAYDLVNFGLGVDGCIRYVSTHPVADLAELDRLHDKFLDQRYEGQIVRLDIAYKQGRSWGVLKRKIFESHEYGVVDIQPGIGNYAGVAKRARFWMPGADRTQVPTKENTFGAGIRGKKPFLAKLLTEDHKLGTVRHFGFTKAGVPRMGVVTNWHGAERVL